MTTARETASSALRVALAKKKITRREFAQKIGKDESWLSRRLNDHVAMSTDDLDLMLKALGYASLVELIVSAEMKTPAFA